MRGQQHMLSGSNKLPYSGVLWFKVIKVNHSDPSGLSPINPLRRLIAVLLSSAEGRGRRTGELSTLCPSEARSGYRKRGCFTPSDQRVLGYLAQRRAGGRALICSGFCF
ncbi:hypothetical protein AAFF_G00012760 [Aldrovandia affinis]|uniref:Uncharacterized protein n=1 Tax=Aldrovandia affinis TaxID=143900 RepID=A0AAD7S6T0_9TELE|nr:hypothetical protein AAFF_G00012760 [Aldrovandia affinis]